MNPNDVIEAYVLDVMRRVPRSERNEIGLELRGLLDEMLAERAECQGKVADDAMVLTMLRDFGAPADVAARYRPPGIVIIPAGQTRSFVLLSIIGVALQWALTLPQVFRGAPLTGWWFSWGLGALWWPGFLAMLAMIAAGIRQTGLFEPRWRPRAIDPERIHRGSLAVGLVWFLVGAALVIALPWIAGRMPAPLARVFAFDSGFLHARAPWVLPLWLASFATLALVFHRGRWSSSMRWTYLAVNITFVLLLLWWVSVGPIFLAESTDKGAKGGIKLVVLFIVLDTIWKLYRQRTRIRIPKGAHP